VTATVLQGMKLNKLHLFVGN